MVGERMTVLTYSTDDLKQTPRYKEEYVRFAFEEWARKQPFAPVIVRKGDGYRSAQVTLMWNLFKAGFRCGETLAWEFDNAPEHMFEPDPLDTVRATKEQ